ncbi:unnamed protein product [Strongylus vulgaris]|uniref:Peptidase M13 N-terminal domain-containing protein n=1 Tax=Strongylus vulgaris TaxID=40348 RepID=A0A3P7IVT2_STRVU|nr:unnamed protein product [Strongylus vulgaris]
MITSCVLLVDVSPLSKIDTTANPCEDFYKYTCGKLEGDMSFSNSEYENRKNMIEQLHNKDYIDRAPIPVKMMANYYEKCVSARLKWDDLTRDAQIPMKAINRLAEGNPSHKDETQFRFYMLYQDAQESRFPSPNGLAFLLGNPIGMDSVSSIVPAYIDTNWKDPHDKDGNALFIDQPSTIIPYKYHVKAWNSAKQR